MDEVKEEEEKKGSKRGRPRKYPEGCREHWKKLGLRRPPPGPNAKPRDRTCTPKPRAAKTKLTEEQEALKGKKVTIEVTEEVAPEIQKIYETKTSPEVPKKIKRSPSFFNEIVRMQCLALTKAGASQATIARVLGVGIETIRTWRKKSQDFSIPETRIRAIANDLVESALFKRATGYEAPKEVVSIHEGEVTKVDSFQHVPPDPQSAMFWLKNRKPDEWRDRIEADVNLIPRLVVQTHLGDETLHDAKTLEDNTPKLLQESDEQPEEIIDESQEFDTKEEPWTENEKSQESPEKSGE